MRPIESFLVYNSSNFVLTLLFFEAGPLPLGPCFLLPSLIMISLCPIALMYQDCESIVVRAIWLAAR